MLFSQSGSSIPSNHEPVSLKELKFELDSKEFSLSVSLLYEALKQGAGNVNSKNDFSNLVWLALLDAIALASLSDNLKVLNKVSLSSSL